MSSDPKSTRRYVRVACNAAAVITTDAGTFPGVCDSLSLGGAFVRCETTPSCDIVSMILCLPSLGPVEVTGEVLYRDPRGCGIRFTSLASNAMTAICTFVGAARGDPAGEESPRGHGARIKYRLGQTPSASDLPDVS